MLLIVYRYTVPVPNQLFKKLLILQIFRTSYVRYGIDLELERKNLRTETGANKE